MGSQEHNTLANSGLSRRALNILQKMGYRADTKIENVDDKYKDFIKVDGCGPQTAGEISKTISKHRLENGG